MTSIFRVNVLRLRRVPVQNFSYCRRYLSAPVSKDAFLEPVAEHPGVVSLALNRPQAKNAISITLLKVFRNMLHDDQLVNPLGAATEGMP
jgi:methylglutaconyl-CoA hydratase